MVGGLDIENDVCVDDGDGDDAMVMCWCYNLKGVNRVEPQIQANEALVSSKNFGRES